MDGGKQWNPKCAFCSIRDSSDGYDCILELMFTLELKPSTVRFKHHCIMHSAT